MWIVLLRSVSALFSKMSSFCHKYINTLKGLVCEILPYWIVPMKYKKSSHRSFTLHILPLTFPLYSLHFSVTLRYAIQRFIHRLPTPYCLLTANISFKSCVLLNGQKEVREPYKYMELLLSQPCLKRRRTNIHHYKAILAQLATQDVQFQCQEQTTYLRSSTTKLRPLRNGNSDSWKTEVNSWHCPDPND